MSQPTFGEIILLGLIVGLWIIAIIKANKPKPQPVFIPEISVDYLRQREDLERDFYLRRQRLEEDYYHRMADLQKSFYEDMVRLEISETE